MTWVSSLRAGEKIILNGCEVSFERPTKIYVHSQTTKIELPLQSKVFDLTKPSEGEAS